MYSPQFMDFYAIKKSNNSNQLLPWLQQQIKELKIAEQQINKIRANIKDVVTADDSTE